MRRHFHRFLGHVPAAAEVLRVSLRGNLAVIAVFVLVPVSGLGALAMPSWAVHRISGPLWHGVSSPLALDRLPGRVLSAGASLGGSEPVLAAGLGVEPPLGTSPSRRERRKAGRRAIGWAPSTGVGASDPGVPGPGDALAPISPPTVAGEVPPPDPSLPKAPRESSETPASDSPVEAPPPAPGSPHDPTASDPSSPPPPPPADPAADDPAQDEGDPSGPDAPSDPGPDLPGGEDPGAPGDEELDMPGKPGKPGKPEKPDKPGNGSPDDKPGKGPPEDNPGSSPPDQPGNVPPAGNPASGPPADQSDKPEKPDKPEKEKDKHSGPGTPGEAPHPGNGKKGGRRRRGSESR